MGAPRTEPMPDLDDEAREVFFDAVAAEVDWKAPPHEVLSDVHDQLRAFGLEVVMLDTGGDSYAWKIERLGGAA